MIIKNTCFWNVSVIKEKYLLVENFLDEGKTFACGNFFSRRKIFTCGNFFHRGKIFLDEGKILAS